MQPTRALWRRGADLLAADATTLAPAINANHVHLTMAPFTPNLDMVLGDFTEATFDGYAVKDIGVGAQPIFYSVQTGLLTIVLEDPAGGYVWATTGVTNLPQTIYGAYLTDNADAVLLGAMQLDNPVTLQASGEGLSFGELSLAFQTDSPG